MGLLDFFTKPRKNSKHHYFFAHLALRTVAFNAPVRIFGVLASKDRVRFFDDLLRDLDTRIQERERRNFSGKDIGFTALKIGERPCAILQMPPTTNPTEAYFVAIVARLPMEQFMAHADSKSTELLIDYYTLERPVEITPDRQSVFCGWTTDTHLNFGGGPAPTLKDFTEFLAHRVEGKAGNAAGVRASTRIGPQLDGEGKANA